MTVLFSDLLSPDPQLQEHCPVQGSAQCACWVNDGMHSGFPSAVVVVVFGFVFIKTA